MLNLRAVLGIACVGALAACGSAESAEPDLSHADIANIKSLRQNLPAPFKVTDVAPTAIDPRIVEPQKLPAQIKFEPADCAKFANQQVLPAGVKGNMAALTAEGEGNRFIVIAVETSEKIPVNGPPENCKKVGFAGPGLRGLIEVVDAPKIDGVETQAAHRVIQTTVGGKPAHRRALQLCGPNGFASGDRHRQPARHPGQTRRPGRHQARRRIAQRGCVRREGLRLNARRAAGTGC